MALDRCLPGLVADGKLSAEQAQEAATLFDELRQDLRRQFGDQAADAMASDATLKALEADLARRRFLAARTIATRQRIEMEMGQYGGGGDGSGPIDPRAGAAFLGGDGRAPYANVDGRMRAVRARAHAMMDSVLADHSSNVLGQVRNRAQLHDMVRELFGEDSGNAHARELADAWTRAAEMLRQRFNAAGGDIGKMERWGLPQAHDSRVVRRAGYDAWRDAVMPRLDRAAMIDRRTGLPFSDQALELTLRDTWESIRSDGWSRREAGGVAAGALANRRGDARFLRFRSAADWLAYSEQFGAGTAFDAMMGHIDGMARDVAMLEVLGPNPTQSIKWIKDSLVRSAELDRSPDSKAVDRAHAAEKSIDRLFAEVTGENTRPESRSLALWFSAVRSWQTATKLGGAMLSAVTDLAFQASTRKFNGLPVASTLRDYARLFRPGSIEDQKLAVRRGLIAEEWSNRTASQQRYLGEEQTGEISRRLAEGVLRVSGLARWTQAGRWAFGMEFLATMTEARAMPLAHLDPGLQRVFARYGLSTADWDAIRAAPTVKDRGTDWIDPPSLPPALGDKLLEMIVQETDYAVPVPDVRTRAMINSVAPRGSLHGEIIKSAFLFKSFGISVLIMHGRRTMEQAGPQAVRYAGGLVIGTTVMGGAAMLLKDLAAGRDPREVDNPEFWAAAALQGGGFGIFGDFVKSGTNRAGGGIPETLAGPIVSDAQGLFDVAVSKNPRGAAFKELRAQLPGGNIWYAKTTFDRLIADQIQEEIDPNYRRSWSRMRKWSREQGTEYWWAPGETAPERAPDLSNLTAGEPAQ